MERDIIVKYLDGQQVVGSLADPFKPKTNLIKLVVAETDDSKDISLDHVCCVQILGTPSNVFSSSEEESMEEVHTVTGESYHVRILGSKEKYPNGFFGFPVEEDSPFRMLFFTFHGLRNRVADEPLGRILVEQGLIDENKLRETLEEQEELRHQRVGEIIAQQQKLSRQDIEKAIAESQSQGKLSQHARVGDILIASGLVSEAQVDEALKSQTSGKRKRIGDLLIDRGLITEEQLLLALATKFRMRVVELSKVEPSVAILRALSLDVVMRMRVLPLEERGGVLVVATSKPTDPEIGDTLRFHTNRKIELVVATSVQIDAAIDRLYSNLPDRDPGGVKNILNELSEIEVETYEEASSENELPESDSQIINLVNQILIDGYNKEASDIHVEPGLERHPTRIRYRIDGVCHLVHQIPAAYQNAFLSRLKILANLDIAERRKPQSGKIMLKFNRRKIEFRVEITPTVGGQEDAVLRLLAASKPLPLKDMGFSHHNLDRFEDALTAPYGIILVVGPTGSGKTTTLHSALGYLNTAERKIWTAEDPVEITQAGLRQVQVNPKIGFDFKAALRSFLRADPDVVMIGEMRDPETAQTAIEASLTGHLVFSTLHTNSAAETVVRLIEMGMDPINFSDALIAILAQRLARRLCSNCKVSKPFSDHQFADMVESYGRDWYERHGLPVNDDKLKVYRSPGCDNCTRIGYKGRIAVHELLLASPELKVGIKRRLMAEELRDLAMQAGMRTLRQDGIAKVIQGHTDMDQIARVCI